MPIKPGDFVKVTSGPGFGAKGKVQSVDVANGTALVRVASGGEWGFMLRDLTVLRKKDR